MPQEDEAAHRRRPNPPGSKTPGRDWPRRLVAIACWIVVIAAATFIFQRMLGALDRPNFHWDGRYLMAAADCLSRGLSPYSIEDFFGCWEARTGTPPRSTFVFPPHSLVPTLPLALFDRPAADILLLALHGIVLAILATLSVALLRDRPISGLAQWTAPGWLALALTNGGILGSIYLGQLSLVAGTGLAALALAVSGSAQRPWTMGLLMAMAKPHLTAIALAASFLLTGMSDMRRKVIAVGVAVLSMAWIFLFDPHLFGNYHEALAFHSTSQFSDVSTPGELFGLPGFLVRMTPQWAMVAVAVTASMAAVTWLFEKGRTEPAEPHLATFAAIALAGAMLVPHKDYDFAIYTVIFLLAARQQLSVQVVLLAPLLVVWRPSLLNLVGVDAIMGGNVALMGLFTGFGAIGLREVFVRRRAADHSAASKLRE